MGLISFVKKLCTPDMREKVDRPVRYPREEKVFKELKKEVDEEFERAREEHPIKLVEYEEVPGHRESLYGKGGLAILFDSDTGEYFVRYRDGWSTTVDSKRFSTQYDADVFFRNFKNIIKDTAE